MLALVACASHATFGLGGAGTDELFTRWVELALIAGAAVACWARVVARREERLAWLVMGSGIALWCAGDFLFEVLDANGALPIPSVADALWIPAYPVMCVAFLLVARSRLSEASLSLWLDGAIAALALAAVASTLVLETVMEATAGSVAVVATGLSYVVMDLVLLMVVTTVFGRSGWRPGRAWLVAGAGLLTLGTADLLWLLQTANGTYVEGSLLDVMWPAAFLLIATAAWQPAERKTTAEEGLMSAAAPAAAAVIAVGLLLYDHFDRISMLGVGFAAATLGLVATRLFVTFLQNRTLLRSSRHEALNDSLTGLSNRRALLQDLESEIAAARPDAPLAVLLLDLNGFKAYNDTFGHPAGDRLLVRLAAELDRAVAGHGAAYRLGGDEFCALISGGSAGVDVVAARVASALSEKGPGFAVDCSHGLALVPADASSAEQALALADRRMYAQKGTHKTSASRQSRDVLMSALSECGPELHAHVEVVADLSMQVARRLGMSAEEVDEVVRAAELHDVGKVAIPDAVLHKPSALDAEEWAFMKRHTIIGERILGAAPALEPVARLVRSTHERFDGRGYPDGLAGHDIPLGARVVFVCDAYDAMTSQRPYSDPLTADAALAELRQCAGTQFDPAVVEAFCHVAGRSAATLAAPVF
ncbi:MAG TPA: HD domain-containing phosphohydrolase [Solirubrobacteraceae bacterium]|nr:HD domain-containing phosphohydrolase [Solirubrobacteraceae bacterium]